MIYLISDTHFNHANIIKYCNRPFKDVTEMNEAMIKNWNAVVDKGDIVLHLGDFCMAPYVEGVSYKDRYIDTANNLLNRLNGKKYLIRGNHDPGGGILAKCNWEDSFREYEILGRYIITHRPIETDLINIHGHIHDKAPFYCENKFNVSVDVINFTPISLYQIEEIIYEERYLQVL